jgi:uncharacterized protein (DUF1015 family)
MPEIRPFKGILPSPSWVERVVAKPPDVLYSDETYRLKAENPYSYLHLMEPVLDNTFARGSVQDQMFKAINENFQEFLDAQVLVKDEQECFYIYLWMCSHIDDYLSNKIKKHELTRYEREVGIINYFENTAIDSNPVLITYPKNDAINRILQMETDKQAALDFKTQSTRHQVWRVDNTSSIAAIIQAFEHIPETYIADGHHRAAAASTLGMQKRKLDLKYKGTEAYNYFSSIYFAEDQMEIYEFNRLVKSQKPMDYILDQLKADFEIHPLPEAIKSTQAQHFVLFNTEKAYALQFKGKINNAVVSGLDVSIVQDFILEPVFGIHNPKTDPHLSFVGGENALNESIQAVKNKKADYGITVYPTSIQELFDVANAGETMPPKSTWFEPKLYCGIISRLIA